MWRGSVPTLFIYVYNHLVDLVLALILNKRLEYY
jgi:hypothetical protein